MEPAPSTAKRPTSALLGSLFWAAFAVALAARVAHLGLRPLHHDEAVNASFLVSVAQGKAYAYNPEGYHGPFLYDVCWWPVRWLGTSEAALRLPIALASALMIPLLLPLRRRLGVAGVTGAAWLLALSPSFIYYGRDLIHETLLAVVTLAVVVSASLWLATRRDLHLLLAAGCLGLLFTVKETAVLTTACLAGAALVTGWRFRSPGLSFPRPRLVFLAAACFAVPYVLLYSSFLTHPRGLLDSVEALFLWIGKGVEGGGHEKPWSYFLTLLVRFEPALAAGGVLGALLALRRRDPFGIFCALWAVGQLAIYSAIPYKTPWLALNVLLPAALCAGVVFREARGRAFRAALAAVFAAALGWSAWRAADLCFRRYDDPGLALAYVETRREARDLVAHVEAAAQRVPGGRKATLNAVLRYRWPLPWYLRNLTGATWRKPTDSLPPTLDADVVLVDLRDEPKLLPHLRQTYRRRVFPVRPNEQVVVLVNEGLER